LEGVLEDEEVPRLALGFDLGVNGLGGVLSIRLRTSSSLGDLSALPKLTSAELTRAPGFKVERAKHHIRDLNSQVSDYLSRRPFVLTLRKNPQLGEKSVGVKTKEAIPENLSAIIGDAVHNLRSALDLLIFAMVGTDALNPDRVQFPFAKRAETLENTIKNRNVHLAGKNVIEAIKALKPYPDGNELLAGLHLLDVQDKHKLIVTVGRSADISYNDLRKVIPEIVTSNITSAQPDAPMFNFNGTGRFILRDGRPEPSIWQRAAARDATTEHETNIQPAFAICFGEGHPFSGEPVIGKLHDMVGEVEGAIISITAAYFE
jgi:hypothetical protein